MNRYLFLDRGRGKIFRSVLFVCTLVIPGLANERLAAQTFQWTNTSGLNSFWQIGNNWNPLGPPGAAQDALFDQNATYDVFWNSATGSLTPSINFVEVNAGDVRFFNAESGSITHTVNDDLLITGAGTQLTNSGLNLVVNNQIRVENNATLIVDGAHSAGSVLTAAGGITEVGSGTLVFNNGGRGFLTGDVNVNVDNPGTGRLNVFGGSVVNAGTINLGNGTAQSASSFGEINVSGAGSRINADLNVGNSTGGGTGNHLLNIDNGGQLDSGLITVLQSGALNIDAGTVNTGNFSSQGVLNISNGGFLNVSGPADVSSGSVLVDGAGSVMTSDIMQVAKTGQSASLQISGGAAVSASVQMVIGSFGDGGVTVTDAGSSLTTTDFAGLDLLVIGSGSGFSGSLQVLNGATVLSQDSVIGDFGSIGVAEVSGAGSRWDNAENLLIGASGNGTLNINTAGFVSSRTGTIGVGLGGIGQVDVEGVASGWTITDQLELGSGPSQGTLNITDGATVVNTFGRIGNDSNGVGTVNVDGANSGWDNSSSLRIGSSGTGHLNITDGAFVINTAGSIATEAGSSGTVTIDGIGSRWINTAQLDVANLGTGSLNLQNGGRLTSVGGIIGSQSTGVGQVVVDGPLSEWTNTGTTVVGENGSGMLTLTNGGKLHNSFSGRVGRFAGGTGVVVVNGSDSQWLNDSFLIVADNGIGSMTISDGGLVTNTNGTVGNFAGTDGSVLVTGAGSQWVNSASLTIGRRNGSSGLLTINDGGNVENNGPGIIGDSAGSTGIVTVGGAASSWFNQENLIIGNEGSGTMNLQSGGLVSVGTTTSIGNQGTVNMSGGRFEFGTTDLVDFGRINATSGSLAGNVNLSGVNDIAALNALHNPLADLSEVAATNTGLLHGSAIVKTALKNQSIGELRTVSGQWARFEGAGNVNAGEINNFGGLVDFAQDLTNTSTGFIGGRGQFVADGGWTNQGVMAFSGTTDVLGDIVQRSRRTNRYLRKRNDLRSFDDLINNGTEIRTSCRFSTPLFLARPAELDSFTGTGTVFFEGDLRPGNSPNSVLFEGDVVLGSGARSFFELGGLGSGLFDQLLVAGDLNLDGALSVELIDGFLLGANQEFLIGDVGGSLFGQFDGLGEGSLVGSFGGRDLFITYGAGNGNDIGLFTAVPEPSSFALLGIAGVLGLAGRRRRNQTATSNRNKQKLPARFVGVSMVVAAGVLLGASNSAIGQTSIWNGGTGNWTDTAMWTGGSPGPTSDVFIDNGNAINSDVTFNTATTINSLTLDSGDQLQITAGRLLSFQGAGSSLINNGSILYQGGSFNGIRILSDTTFSGNGTIRLTDSTSRINGSIPPAALINGAGHTIEGGGQIGSRTFFTNNGLVNANISGLNINISTEDGNFNNNGIVRASTGGQISMATSGIMNGGTYEAIGSGSQVVIQGGTVRNATLNGTAGGVVIHSASANAAAFDNINNQGAFQFQTADFSGFLNNSGTMVFTNNSNANMRLASNLSASGGGTLSFVQGGSNISGNFHASIGDQTLIGKGSFTPASMAMTSGTILAPSNPTRTRGGPAEVGIFEFDTAGQLFTSGIEMQFDLAGTTVNGAAPNLLQVNTGLDADLISFGIDYDQINVFDSLKMQDNPLIDVSLIDGFTPQVGDFFDILTADELQLVGNIDFSFPVLNGLTFDHDVINLFDSSRGTNRDVLRLTWGAAAVPEPGSTVLIAALGSIFLVLFRRRQLV